MSWFTRLFERVERLPLQRAVEVGKATVKVTCEDDVRGTMVHRHEVVGEYYGKHPLDGGDWVTDAAGVFEDWRAWCGKVGTWSLGKDADDAYLFVPTHRIIDIVVTYSDHQVLVEA